MAAAKDFVAQVIELSTQVAKASKRVNHKLARRFMSEREIAQMGDVYFLGAASAKVLHSAEELGYVNAVQYLAPADRAATSLLVEFPDIQKEMASTGRWKALEDALKAAARQEPLWAPFAAMSPEVGRTQAGLLETVQNASKDKLDYVLPDMRNRVLSLCPFASKDCRDVCLNTSGQGGMARTDKLVGLQQQARQAGYTHVSDTQYLYYRGYKAFYGGETNSVTAARIRRTHMMLLSWAREGVLDNTYNEMLLGEALKFREGAKRLGKPMALRLNGTSDFPAHTFLVRGKNLMQTMHAHDVVCYDYSKHFQKVEAWMGAKAWAPKSSPAVVHGFPRNYHLVFSWSENNARRALEIMKKGGNVVMVFRRSLQTSREDDKAGLSLPKQANRKGSLPTHIHLAQMSPTGEGWEAEVVDGDAHDLRFLDPYNVGKPNGGMVVGLIAKGQAIKAYGVEERRRTWAHFTSPVTLKRIGEQLHAEVRENPGELGAVQEVDADILKASTVKVDGWAVVPTNMAT